MIKNSMSIKEKVENNIWKVIGGFVVTSVLATFGVLQFLHNEKIKNLELQFQTKLDECNNTISSIKIGLGNDPKLYFNVKKVFVKSTDRLEDASKLKFYNSDEFYTLADSSYWKHSIGYSYEGAKQYSKLEKRDYTKQIEVLKKHLSKVHFWEGGKVYKVQRSSVFESTGNLGVMSSIGLEKMNIDSLATMNAEAQEPGHIEEFKIWYKKQGLVNALITFIDQQRIVAKYYPETSFEIQDIRIEDEFIFLKAISIVKNALINDKLMENFYIRSETIGLLNKNIIYVITIVEPITDKLSSNPEITKWLNNLKIITD